MAINLREQGARKILRIVRSKGHPYVDLRENGKRFIYFCTLCLAPCYSDTILKDHLKGKLHKQRLSTAKVTLLKPNPWPFNDGVVFFDTSIENDQDLEDRNDNLNRWLLRFIEDDEDNLANEDFVEPVQPDAEPSFVIPHVLIGDETVDVKVREVGLGKISARFLEIDNSFIGIKRIWCEWLGNENHDQQEDGVVVPDHDFAVVIFSYNYDLGQSGFLADIKSLRPSASMPEPENKGESSRKRKPPSSDPEDTSDSVRNPCDSSVVEGSSASNNATPTPRLTLAQFDNQLLRTLISSRAERKKLRQRHRLAAEKMCYICQQKMLPGKDIAAFFNLKTGRLACSSQNETGAFHLFHTACVIHWILLCEFHIITEKGNHIEAASAHIKSVFCPECIIVDGDRLGPTPNLSFAEMFKLKIKAHDARREWIKSPEVLEENCSIGFHFPSESEETVQEKVEPLKLLRFYRADNQDGA